MYVGLCVCTGVSVCVRASVHACMCVSPLHMCVCVCDQLSEWGQSLLQRLPATQVHLACKGSEAEPESTGLKVTIRLRLLF